MELWVFIVAIRMSPLLPICTSKIRAMTHLSGRPSSLIKTMPSIFRLSCSSYHFLGVVKKKERRNCTHPKAMFRVLQLFSTPYASGC
ncbi:hypothetical protein NPIL_524531 [Nephila pilipes]|uniref:Uncharacterized protein n=1 Tax=Nephila pilipes TaxID=299642 RepID=A0A8X6USS3_NEPPI|nr:hypothetical protein NPIL_524531 [Nephila pilipes]